MKKYNITMERLNCILDGIEWDLENAWRCGEHGTELDKRYLADALTHKNLNDIAIAFNGCAMYPATAKRCEQGWPW